MPDNLPVHHRRSIRLAGYDYSQSGAYFITIVTQDRVSLFGSIIDGKMQLNEWGQIVRECWVEIPAHFPNAVLDEFVVMPNHVHGIIVLVNPSGATNVGATHVGTTNMGTTNVGMTNMGTTNMGMTNVGMTNMGMTNMGTTHVGATHASPLPARGPQRQSVSSIVGSFKSAVTKRINQQRGTPGASVWQRNYYEHIVRNEEEWRRIAAYIRNNPSRWKKDREN